MAVAGGSAVVTLGEATSLGFIIGVTLGYGTWMGITLCERRGASEGHKTGVGGVVAAFAWGWQCPVAQCS
jgi:hypothetical protein